MQWPVSVCLLCYNEEKNLEKYFSHVRSFAPEIIAVDSGSSDRSIEIARRHADIIVLHPLDDFSAQRNLATSKATNRWVLHLDADETLSPPLVEALSALFEKGRINQCAAYCFPRMTFDEQGKLRKIVESYPGFHYRLYDRARCEWVRPVHETLVVNGPKKFIPHHIIHYPDYSRIPEKVDLYTELKARPNGARVDSTFRSMLSNFLFHARALFVGLGMWKRPGDFFFACRWLIHHSSVRLRRRLGR